MNGVLVSDFYTPDFFDPVTVSSVRYSFTGAIKAPRTVLRDGYISWHDTVTGHWMQLRMFADDLSSKSPHVVDLNTQSEFARILKTGVSLRSAIDRVTSTARRVQKGGQPVARVTRMAARRVEDAASAHATMWRAQIKRVKVEARKDAGSASRGRKRPR